MRDFVRLPRLIYAGNPCYVPDLEADIRDTFDPRKNAGLDFTDIQPFVAYDERGRAVGRIAGIINHRANEKWGTRNVRFGFIEFVDDPRVSAALLQAVEQWGREHGMDKIEGPMGIFDFDKEGMLVEDFDQMGSMVTIYNPPYYPRHLEALGYTKEVDWVQVSIEVPAEVPAKYERVARLSKEMFGLPVVENEQGELVGVAITMPSLSHALRKAGGRMFPLGWLHLIRALKWKRESKAELFLIAVRLDYQGLGVNALFFADLIPVYNRLGFTRAETGPQLEDNVKELSQWKPLNPTLGKRRRCYGKAL